MSDFKKTTAFLVYAMCYHETVHDKWVYVKAFGKLKMAQNTVIINTGRTLAKLSGKVETGRKILKAMLTQNFFGGEIRCIMGNVEVAYWFYKFK